MRKLVILLMLCPFLSCKQTQNTTDTRFNFNTTSIQQRLDKDLNRLTHDELGGRLVGTVGQDKAADYLANQFKQMGVKPFYTTYRDSFMVKNKHAYNVVAYIPGKNKSLSKAPLLIGAHYDHIGIDKRTATATDSIANGANDNASGTIAVLEIARYFSENPPERAMIFALFDAEEQGLLGSEHLAQRMKNENQELYGVFNLEMIGVPLKAQNYQAYLTGFDSSNMAQLFNNYTGSNSLGFFEKAQEFQLFKRSDNYPFYKHLGIPAQTVCTFDFSNYPYYHHVKDEMAHLDLEHMARLIQVFQQGLTGMVNAKENELKFTN